MLMEALLLTLALSWKTPACGTRRTLAKAGPIDAHFFPRTAAGRLRSSCNRVRSARRVAGTPARAAESLECEIARGAFQTTGDDCRRKRGRPRPGRSSGG